MKHHQKSYQRLFHQAKLENLSLNETQLINYTNHERFLDIQNTCHTLQFIP